MPMNKIVATKRGRAMVAAAIIAAAAGGWNTFIGTKLTPAKPDITPAIVREAVDKGISPPAVILAVEVIKKWEGFSNIAYQDQVGVWTFGFGETMIDGRRVRKGDYISREDAEKRLVSRVTHDYFMPLVDKVPEFTKAPDSVQAGVTSLSYNVGSGRAATSSSATDIAKYNYEKACTDLLAFNKARIDGKLQEVRGLTSRRGMGDPGRAGEAEVCMSGLKNGDR